MQFRTPLRHRQMCTFICSLVNTYSQWRPAVRIAWARNLPIIYYHCFSTVHHTSKGKHSIKVHLEFASRFYLLLSSRASSLAPRSGRSTFAPPAGIVWSATDRTERSERSRIRSRYGWKFLASSNVFN
jgi:hypothetical protein